MGIFYHPPHPPTGSTAATPPTPHDPIPAQGDQPPRYSTAIMLVAVLASWPADLEPRLTRPNDQQQKIAPLTLKYGSPPTPSGPVSVTQYAQLAASWPLDLEPRLGRPNEQQQKIAPLTLTYGQQPRPAGPLTPVEISKFVASWPPTDVGLSPPYPQYPNARLCGNLVVTQPKADPPPIAGAATPTDLAAIVAAWADTWGSQSAPKNAGWNVPPILSTVAYAPPQKQIWTSWEPPWISPPAPVAVATLTLPTGQLPPRAVPDRQITASAAWVPDALVARQPPPAAATSVLPAQVAYAPLPLGIRAAWDAAWTQPPSPVAIVTLSLPTGASPPPQAPLSVSALTAIVGTWAQSWDSQTAPKSAAWNIPAPTVPFVPRPRLIWAAWDQPWTAVQPPVSAAAWSSASPVPYRSLPLAIRAAWDDAVASPPRPVVVAPLTLVYGQIVPPARGPMQLILTAWTPPLFDIRPALVQAIFPGPPGVGELLTFNVSMRRNLTATAWIRQTLRNTEER